VSSDGPVSCDFCGRRAPEGSEAAHAQGVPLTWTTATENGRSKVFCAECSRRHLRAIEGKLDSEAW
jgi:hypothetical protein